MARTQTMVQLSEELLDDLDQESRRRGCSRSSLIREAIVEHLARTSAAADVARYVDSYRNEPQLPPDEWGSLESTAAHASVLALRAMDAEEAQAGVSW